MLAWGELGDSGERDVDAVEEGVLHGRSRHARSVAVIRGFEFSGERNAGASVLGFLLAQAFASELDEGGAEDRIVGSFGDFHRGAGDGVDPFFGASVSLKVAASALLFPMLLRYVGHSYFM